MAVNILQSSKSSPVITTSILRIVPFLTEIRFSLKNDKRSAVVLISSAAPELTKGTWQRMNIHTHTGFRLKWQLQHWKKISRPANPEREIRFKLFLIMTKRKESWKTASSGCITLLASSANVIPGKQDYFYTLAKSRLLSSRSKFRCASLLKCSKEENEFVNERLHTGVF